MVFHDLAHLGADLGERLLPADLFKPVTDALQGNAKPVVRMMNLVVAKPLDTGIALADDVVGVGLDGKHAVVFDRCFQPAGRFADAAEREFGSMGHGGKGASMRERRQG